MSRSGECGEEDALFSMFRAVHINDEKDQGVYWDGLFSQNPPIRDFLQAATPQSSKPDEIWIIRIDPGEERNEPQSVQQIDVRRNVLSGNLSLDQEIFFIEKVNEWVRAGLLAPNQFKTIRIRDELRLGLALGEDSKIDRSPQHIQSLIALGERQARHFLTKLD